MQVKSAVQFEESFLRRCSPISLSFSCSSRDVMMVGGRHCSEIGS